MTSLTKGLMLAAASLVALGSFVSDANAAGRANGGGASACYYCPAPPPPPPSSGGNSGGGNSGGSGNHSATGA